MRINELVKVGERTEQRIIHHDDQLDDNGNIIADAWDEVIDVEVPVMGMVYRDATPEEIAEFERQQAEMQEPEPTPEERLAEVEAVSDMAYINSELALAMLEEMEV